MKRAGKGKIRELGVVVGKLPTGAKNDLTDVPGVRVGHVTIQHELEDGECACTGVTAILPHGGSLFREKVTAASYVINGFGKTTGLVQVNELGVLESPIMLTNTFSVPAVTQGALQYMLATNEEIGDTTGTVNIVVGECNDGHLNSIRRCVVRPEDAVAAIENATEHGVEEGAVGAGTGMVAFGYKGGIGSSSRVVSASGHTYTLGALVLSNFGSKDDFLGDRLFACATREPAAAEAVEKEEDGSIMIVLATDAPLSDRQLLRVAKRAGIGLGRTGSHFGHGSGDIAIAFSTAHKIPHRTESVTETRVQLREDHPVMNELFAAAAEATEEAIYNSLSQAVTTTGRKGRTVHAMPLPLR
ncbi:P1 family peptidase [Brevibacillus agri]|uniref:DmpA family aminopeptidase n=1 Tax=Brevibacillus agri TaxID=51101 RepID=UPI0002A4E49D|nr:P1 family peptidase [Brevibacillus agri]ELK41157.1 D-aminopeptidase [Brevibacillus agri BAB-2500]MDR9506762.1 P1 family peptidase [Brevibacillus agri]MED3498947.1 P1 family peptidase [Brevibacillus agri]